LCTDNHDATVVCFFIRKQEMRLSAGTASSALDGACGFLLFAGQIIGEVGDHAVRTGITQRVHFLRLACVHHCHLRMYDIKGNYGSIFSPFACTKDKFSLCTWFLFVVEGVLSVIALMMVEQKNKVRVLKGGS
jgi:hypothetical protein